MSGTAPLSARAQSELSRLVADAPSDARAIGVDVVDVPRLRARVERRGERLLARLLTDRERALCAGASDGYRWYCLAGRVAAKEAAKKTLAPYGAGMGWLDIEVIRGTREEPVLLFHGQAEELWRKTGFADVFLSITHDADVALAIVVAI
ncbi:holo-ACP synthase [Streptomyces collinus]|uniref:holo-ACP synthase n=1 Tax=Streptomyces collinus TaxID=42684 RepID=UPI0038218C25